jgi:hypothetical protein
VKLKEAQDTYESRSTRVSEIVRQLNLAGIAVIWLFRNGDKTGGIPYNDALLWPLGFFIISAGFDLLQFAYASAAWGIFSRQQEKKLNQRIDEKERKRGNEERRRKRGSVEAKDADVEDDDEIDEAPGAINWVSNSFFWGKAILTVVGYYFLISYIARYLFAAPANSPVFHPGVI